ncbi:hypothetical protein FAES_3216 [Fibrella aestuarina BUZ 2]|uniref:Uncharacterized protein n=1 Tax=Fibrella aestuarina BUZ 2 TaxID=1166018 RepID=I0KAS2_9BACT|nr:hypothetical protein [Fibrella aestuarina]CCH01225.1 hypothetical protein FAES_3216 [Fibrella aestuarina BUZ 2]
MAKRKKTVDPINNPNAPKKKTPPEVGVIVGKAGSLGLIHQLTLTEKKVTIERQPLVTTDRNGQPQITSYDTLYGDRSAYTRLIDDVFENPCEWPEQTPNRS